MKKELNLTALLVETFGQNYVDLVSNDKKKNARYILNCRLSCIKSIISDRKSMGRNEFDNNASDFFDWLYDNFDLYELQKLEVEYRDMAWEFHNKKI